MAHSKKHVRRYAGHHVTAMKRPNGINKQGHIRLTKAERRPA